MNSLKKFGLLVGITILCVIPSVSSAQSISVDSEIVPITTGGVRVLVNSVNPVSIISINAPASAEANRCMAVGQQGQQTASIATGTTNALASGSSFYARYGTTPESTAVGGAGGTNSGAFSIPAGTQLSAVCGTTGSVPTFRFTNPLSYSVSGTFQPGTTYYFRIHLSVPGYPTFSTPIKSITIGNVEEVSPATGTSEEMSPATGPSTQINNRLRNPLGDKITSVPAFIEALIKVLLTIGVPIIAIMIIWSGFLLVTARGNAEKIKQGKQAFLAAVIGGAILLGAYVIASAIGATIDQIKQ